jgi:DNA topoisomerase IA
VDFKIKMNNLSIALCVAEKASVAKAVAEFLSRGQFRKVLSLKYLIT